MILVARGFYQFLTTVAGPFLVLWLRYRAHRGKEIPARLPERFGIARVPRPDGRLAWFHAASVGESQSLLPLIRAVAERGWHVLVTTGTVTSASLLAERLSQNAIHQFIPLDRTAWVRRFLSHWRPDLVLWTESELWPNMLSALARQRIPTVLVNGRLSDRAFKGWRRWPSLARDCMNAFSLILAQSAMDRDRFAALGAREAHVVGNLKYAAAPLPADETVYAALRDQIGGRPHWLAASIHPGEDVIVAETHRQLKIAYPNLLTIVVPRHPPKAADMATQMKGLNVVLRSSAATLSPQTDVYIADTMGELGLFYRLCDIVFVGKSLAVGGGQNPAEPAQIGCALIWGPDMSNFRDMTAELLAADAAETVANGAGLSQAVDTLLANPEKRGARVEAGRKVVSHHAAALDETLHSIAPYLEIR